MARRPHVRTGTTGGCLFNGCLVLCVLLLVAVVGTWIRVATQPGRDEDEARAHLRETVEMYRERLARAAADGSLRDEEIGRLFPPMKPAEGLVDIRRQGKSTTAVVGLLGMGPARTFIFVSHTTVKGCYAFHVPPPAHEVPRVSVRQLPDEACTRSSRGGSPPNTLPR